MVLVELTKEEKDEIEKELAKSKYRMEYYKLNKAQFE